MLCDRFPSTEYSLSSNSKSSRSKSSSHSYSSDQIGRLEYEIGDIIYKRCMFDFIAEKLIF